MKTKFLAVALIFTAAALAFANGNAERLTWMEGEVANLGSGEGGPGLALRLENGELVRIRADSGDIANLALTVRERIRVQGVYVGATVANRAEARIFARVMTVKGKDVTLENPVRLESRDRIQLKEFESERTQAKTPDRTGSENSASKATGESAGNTGGR